MADDGQGMDEKGRDAAKGEVSKADGAAESEKSPALKPSSPGETGTTPGTNWDK